MCAGMAFITARISAVGRWRDEMIPTLAADGAGIEQAASIVRGGGIVAFPTETLYGLAADPHNRAALSRLMQIKGRAKDLQFPLLVADQQMLEGLVGAIDVRARQLMDAHWPGPLTLILPAAMELPPQVVNPQGGIGVRVSSDPVAAALVRAVGGPITATSANRTGHPAATTASQAGLEGVQAVIDDGPRASLASTVVDMLDEPVIVRRGAIEVEGVG